MLTGPGPGPLEATRATMTLAEHCRLVNDFCGGDRRASAGLVQQGQESYRLLAGPLFRYQA
jgi:hypothetical protein